MSSARFGRRKRLNLLGIILDRRDGVCSQTDTDAQIRL
jgi:hypothetical protein